MALTLDSTVATTTANSFVDVAFCDDYWANHYLTQRTALWQALSADQKVTTLIQACAIINTLRFTSQRAPWTDTQLVYDRRQQALLLLQDQNIEPVRYYYYQTLQFPRNLDVDVTTGDPFIPEPVKRAQCEQAGYLLAFDDSTLATIMQGVEVEAAVIGPIREHQKFNTTGTTLAPLALENVRPFLLRTSSKLRRG